MKLHIVGHKSSVNGLVDRLTTQLNTIFPEIDDKDFPIEFVSAGVYNGGIGILEFNNERLLRGFCEGKPKEALNKIPALTVGTFSYRNIGSVVAQLSRNSSLAPEDSRIIVTPSSYTYLHPDTHVPDILLYPISAMSDYMCTYHPMDRVLVLGCPNKVSPNNTKIVAFSIATIILLNAKIATPDTLYCLGTNSKGKCIMYETPDKTAPFSSTMLDERTRDFCNPCLEKITEAARSYLEK